MDIQYASNVLSHTFEKDHWWIRSRFDLIDRVLARRKPDSSFSVLEVGCGTGVNLHHVKERYATRLTQLIGTDPHASQPYPIGLDIRPQMPAGDFDVLLVMDVLEHTAEPISLLKDLSSRASASSVLLVTVPAFQWLWTTYDVLSHHQKRYSFSALKSELSTAGWMIDEQFFLFGTLFPIALIQRLGIKWGWVDAHVFAPMPSLLNTLFYGLTWLEMNTWMRFNRWIGTSIVAIAHKADL